MFEQFRILSYKSTVVEFPAKKNKLNIQKVRNEKMTDDDDSERIRIHLIEGWRTVIVDRQVKFGQVIDSITERLSTQYAANHNTQPQENKYGWIFGIRFVPPGMDQEPTEHRYNLS